MIVCGDSLAALKKMESARMDLTLTSPPYFGQREYGRLGLGNEERIEDYIGNLLETFREVVRVTKPTGNIVYNLGDKAQDGSLLLVPYRFALAALETPGVRLVNDITWVKKNPAPHQYPKRLVRCTEPFFHFALGRDYHHDAGEFMREEEPEEERRSPGSGAGAGYLRLIEASALPESGKRGARAALRQAVEEVHRGEIHDFRMKIRGVHKPAYGDNGGGRKTQMDKQGFTIIRLKGNRMKRDLIESPVDSRAGENHPAAYPVKLAAEIVRLLCPPGGTVLDPYFGSGSTGAAATITGRNWVGIEINPRYCREARRRIGKIQSGESEI